MPLLPISKTWNLLLNCSQKQLMKYGNATAGIPGIWGATNTGSLIPAMRITKGKSGKTLSSTACKTTKEWNPSITAIGVTWGFEQRQRFRLATLFKRLHPGDCGESSRIQERNLSRKQNRKSYHS